MIFTYRAKKHCLRHEYKSYEVVDDSGVVIGTIQQYGGYSETKPRGSKIVSTRKNTKLWSYTRVGGETSYGHRSRNAALESMTWMSR